MKTLKTLIPTKSIAFNLGGYYNAEGQKCAAALVGDGLVYFVDIARGLDYFFECELDVSAIRSAYNYNRSIHVALEDYDSKNVLRRSLEQLATTARSI